jgi:hypothetical protein
VWSVQIRTKKIKKSPKKISNPHNILAKGANDSPPVILFADQNFVSTLSGGTSCIAIARLEDANLIELMELSLEIFDRHTLPPGTLLLYGTVSHLFNAGTTAYAYDWCNLVSRIPSTYRDIRVLPLIPIIREDCSGTVNRQLIEISSWFSRVYSKNTLGLTSLWQNLIEILSLTDEDGLDLGYWETYSVAFPAMLAPGAPLTTFKFSSNTSHTTTRGMVSEASNVLLSTLINLLQCNFATAANSEDIFSAEPASQESSLDKKVVYVFGGSNMKKVIPHLDSQRVRDLRSEITLSRVGFRTMQTLTFSPKH